MRRQSRRLDFSRRQSLSIDSSHPTVSAPLHLLNGSFTSECAATAIMQGPTAKIDHVSLAILSLHQIGMPRTLQFDVGTMPRAQDAGVGMQFVWTGKTA